METDWLKNKRHPSFEGLPKDLKAAIPSVANLSFQLLLRHRLGHN
jgi:hypothetical protein